MSRRFIRNAAMACGAAPITEAPEDHATKTTKPKSTAPLAWRMLFRLVDTSPKTLETPQDTSKHGRPRWRLIVAGGLTIALIALAVAITVGVMHQSSSNTGVTGTGTALPPVNSYYVQNICNMEADGFGPGAIVSLANNEGHSAVTLEMVEAVEASGDCG